MYEDNGVPDRENTKTTRRTMYEDNGPTGWKSAIDPKSKKTYYYNRSTGEKTWKRPTSGTAEGALVPDRENIKTKKRKHKKHKQKKRENQKAYRHGTNASKRRKMHRPQNKRREQRSQKGSEKKDDDSTDGVEGAKLDPKIARTKTETATSLMDTKDEAKKEISERGAAVMQRIRAARAKRLQQQKKKKKLANASKDKQIQDRQTSKRNQVGEETVEEKAKTISQKKSNEQNECKSASAINDDGERKSQSAAKAECSVPESDDKNKTAENEREISERGRDVMARLIRVRAKRLKEQQLKKARSRAASINVNGVKQLRIMTKDAEARGDLKWANTLRMQIRQLQCQASDQVPQEGKCSLLIYFPPPCASAEIPSQLLDADLPLTQSLMSVSEETTCMSPVQEPADDDAPTTSTEQNEQKQDIAAPPARKEDLKLAFHKIMANVITLGDFPARMRGFLQLIEVPMAQLMHFKSEAYEYMTLLMQVAKHGHKDLAVLLIDEYAAPVNAQSTDKSTAALHLAMAHKRFDVVDALLLRGADAALVDACGYTPFYTGVMVQARYSKQSKTYKNASIVSVKSDFPSGCIFRVQFTGYDDETDVPGDRVRVARA